MFKLPEINTKETKEKVEEILEEYRIALLSEPVENYPKITQTFSLLPPSTNNKYNSSTEEVAVKRVDLEIARKKLIKEVQQATNRLPFRERSIIVLRYMQQDQMFDYEVYNELGLSERSYYRLKARAFYNLAFVLKIEVYKEATTA
ncbi:ArpU family phage packaging/lysis transcriptional regulator [Alkalihalobacillus sp. LMS39]|uniref:ArpU family phage packaging/lysis transcriptional regulator n=1 Tax=Alkalihalobacillus sp. LMS39 TaxID=2924032 RepID=UPI001FB4F057|nr:ArpU family phage packaging/lysis transcriptional regulator [Alkalihalobacillus sp. LMS39]UOE96060.1 ArpU family transcriptional regulator [Alkalihalobacillus sp. LMS39]